MRCPQSFGLRLRQLSIDPRVSRILIGRLLAQRPLLVFLDSCAGIGNLFVDLLHQPVAGLIFGQQLGAFQFQIHQRALQLLEQLPVIRFPHLCGQTVRSVSGLLLQIAHAFFGSSHFRLCLVQGGFELG